MTQINQNYKRKFPILVVLSNEIEIQKLEITKFTKLGKKISSITGLATNSALTAVKKIIPDFSSLVKEKQSITQKLLQFKRMLLVIIMTNILLLQISIR